MARHDNLPQRGIPASARKRRVDQIAVIPRFLIVCEGTQTEPNYFRQFRVPKDVLEIEGIGYNTIRLVEHALKRSRDADPPYDQVWCVFDRDEFPPAHFNRALDLARQHGLYVAYSNEAFELWFLLHYDFHTSGITRAVYVDKLSKRLGQPYRKNDRELYALLEDRQPQAIQRAAALLLRGTGDPANDNPSTTVHLLVQELREAARRPWER